MSSKHFSATRSTSAPLFLNSDRANLSKTTHTSTDQRKTRQPETRNRFQSSNINRRSLQSRRFGSPHRHYDYSRASHEIQHNIEYGHRSRDFSQGKIPSLDEVPSDPSLHVDITRASNELKHNVLYGHLSKILSERYRNKNLTTEEFNKIMEDILHQHSVPSEESIQDTTAVETNPDFELSPLESHFRIDTSYASNEVKHNILFGHLSKSRHEKAEPKDVSPDEFNRIVEDIEDQHPTRPSREQKKLEVTNREGRPETRRSYRDAFVQTETSLSPDDREHDIFGGHLPKTISDIRSRKLSGEGSESSLSEYRSLRSTEDMFSGRTRPRRHSRTKSTGKSRADYPVSFTGIA